MVSGKSYFFTEALHKVTKTFYSLKINGSREAGENGGIRQHETSGS
jgi:hypothetical protein